MAPTLAYLTGLPTPAQSEGRVVMEALDASRTGTSADGGRRPRPAGGGPLPAPEHAGDHGRRARPPVQRLRRPPPGADAPPGRPRRPGGAVRERLLQLAPLRPLPDELHDRALPQPQRRLRQRHRPRPRTPSPGPTCCAPPATTPCSPASSTSSARTSCTASAPSWPPTCTPSHAHGVFDWEDGHPAGAPGRGPASPRPARARTDGDRGRRRRRGGRPGLPARPGPPRAPLGARRRLHRPPLPPGGAPAATGTATPRRRSTCPRIPEGHLEAQHPVFKRMRAMFGAADFPAGAGAPRPGRLLRPDHLPGRQGRAPARRPGRDRAAGAHRRRLHLGPRRDGRRARHVAQVQLLRALRARAPDPGRPGRSPPGRRVAARRLAGGRRRHDGRGRPGRGRSPPWTGRACCPWPATTPGGGPRPGRTRRSASTWPTASPARWPCSSAARYKLIYSLDDPPLLFDLRPTPASSRTWAPTRATRRARGPARRLLAGWDPVGLERRVRQEQKERLLIRAATHAS